MQTSFTKPLKFKKSHFCSRDVCWFAPRRKTPVAYSTKADADNINMLLQEFGNYKSILSAHSKGKIILGHEEIELLQIMLSYKVEH